MCNKKIIKYELFKEYKQIIKKSNGEFITSNYSFENYYKKYTKSIEQKVYCIEQISMEKNLIHIFLAITLDSRFHQFQAITKMIKGFYKSYFNT